MGIICLEEIIKEVRSLELEDNEELKAELLKRAKVHNHISPHSGELYAEALLNEYRKYLIEDH